MFGFLANRKRTLVEKIVDKARKTITKQRDYHYARFNDCAADARRALDKMHHHKALYDALNEKVQHLDGPMILRQSPDFDNEDFGLGEELAGDETLPYEPIGRGLRDDTPWTPTEPGEFDPTVFDDTSEDAPSRELVELMNEPGVFDNPVTNDMGDGRSATDTDTLRKIETARVEMGFPLALAGQELPPAPELYMSPAPATSLADEVIAEKRQTKRNRKRSAR